MGERIRQLRVALGLSQDKLGQALGMTRSGVYRIEKGDSTLTASNMELLRLKYGVNIEWLETGHGPMFLEPPGDELTALARAYKLRNRDIALISRIVELSEPQRDAVLEFILSVAAMVRVCDEPSSLAGTLSGVPPDREALHAVLDDQLDKEKEAAGGSAACSSGGSGTA